MGKEFTLLGALVQRGEEITGEEVTVKLYSLVGEEWVDVTAQVADGKYTPATEGKLKVEYTCGEIAPVVYEIDVLDYSVVFDPSFLDHLSLGTICTSGITLSDCNIAQRFAFFKSGTCIK